MDSKPSVKQITPIGAYLLVEKQRVEEVTSGGIILTPKHRDQLQLGALKATIVALGHEAFLDFHKGTPMPSKGDYVVTARYAGLDIDCVEGVFSICKDEDVIAVIKGDK